MIKPHVSVNERGARANDERACVLLVEDDASLLRAVARVLEFDGFSVLPAATARSACAQAREHAGAIRVIVTDISLPDRSATELASDLTRACPSTPILFMSGSPQGSDLPALTVPVQFLSKPFSPADLEAALHALHVI
jgi:DNA-binding response OmpR family regulator